MEVRDTSAAEGCTGLRRLQLRTLFHAGIYYAYAASGFLIIYFCPAPLFPQFSQVYPTANLGASLVVYLFYTNSRSRLLDVVLAGAIAVLAGSYLGGAPLALLYATLVFSFVLADYSASQAFSSTGVALSRAAQLAPLALLPFSFVACIESRIAVAFVTIAISIFRKNYPDIPSLRSFAPSAAKVVSVGMSNAVYFLPLIAIGFAQLAQAKAAYLVYAIAATLLIRLIDFEVKQKVGGGRADLRGAFLAISVAGALAITGLAIIADSLYAVLLACLPLIYLVRIRYLALHWT